MKKLLIVLIMLFAFTYTFSQVEGTWKMSPQAAALGVGPSLGDISWWSNSESDVITRACYFDDRFVFAEDGTFSNEQDDESWIESWQGMDPEGCGTPVAPHDGSNAATWTYDDNAGTITLDGVGAYLGLPKVYNGGELSDPADAPESITYPVEFNAAGDTMTINISIGTGYWRFILTTNAVDPPVSVISLPVTFDDEELDYNLVDFGGTTSNIIVDPSDSENNVVQTIKSDGAETWAGTTVAEPFGLEPAVPFEEGSTILSMRVFSPEAGLPILFKLEVWDNTSTFVETISNTTVANEWETIYFDFSNENPESPPLDFANSYNKPVIFFNFGVDGGTAGELTFMWDDIEFDEATTVSETDFQQLDFLQNPVGDILTLNTDEKVESVYVYSLSGQTYIVEKISQNKYDVSHLSKGLYTVLVIDENGNKYSGKVMKQ